jgi:predicted nuclease of predicted toxin-antitoxin system
MRFKTDENIPSEAVAVLRHAGHDATSAVEQSLGGQPDGSIASVCREEGRALITPDMDFSDIRTYPPADYPGRFVLRLARQSTPQTDCVPIHAIGLDNMYA